MRRISLVFVTLVCTLTALSTVSFAADQYAYRAGQPYLKSTAGNYSECEAQCRGDAACRGWNFIQPNPRSRTGICEFNARKAIPVSSPISISGEINTSIDPVMSRAVPIASGNTVRVGTPIMPKPVVTKRPVIVPRLVGDYTYAPQSNILQKNLPQRIIKKLPVDTIIRAPIPAGYKPISEVRLQPLTGPVQPRSMTRQQIYNEQMMAAQKRAEAQARAKMQQTQYSAISAPRLPQQFVPKMKQAPKIQQAPRVPVIPMAAPNPQALYGSLYDDLTQNMTPVPRPQTAPDQFGNPDAPIATSRVILPVPVPTVPVQASPLGYPAIQGQQIPRQQIPGLAGG